MRSGRRQFLRDTAWLALGAAAACKTERAPAFLRQTDREVAQLLPGLPSVDGAGVHLSRLIGQPALRNLDPFVLLDRLHASNPDDYQRGFPDHPHRGFETVTVMFDGHMRHRDSRGNHGDIVGGGAQWMTAGRGIVHSEMPDQERGWMSGYQLWVNLPAREKFCEPRYQDLQPQLLAEARLGRENVLRLIAGEVDGLHGPVRARPTAPLLLTLTLEDDHPVELEIPEGHAAFVAVERGSILLGPEPRARAMSEGALAVLGEGRRLRLRSPVEWSAVLVGAGKPLGEPIVQRGPFVMNTEAEIQQAYDDYRRGVLDKS